MDQFDRPKRASCCRVRLTIAILATFCPIVCYIGRQNLSMAIVSMVDDNQITGVNSSSTPKAGSVEELDVIPVAGGLSFAADTSCPVEVITDDGGAQHTTIVKSYGPKYKVDSNGRNIILSAFFFTYVLFQIPSARLAERFGAKWILVAAGTGSALLSLISPWAISQSVYALAGVRALMGVCQTALYPACFVLYAKWLPPVERSLAIPILCVGAYVGSIVASALTGFFSEQEHFGWPYAFYTPGVLCALWTVLWVWLGANEPRQHKSISLEELQHIESKMEQSNTGASKEIGWAKMLKSRSIWAMMAAFVGSNWSFTVVLLLLPTYLNDILHIPPLMNGIINSIIYGLFCVASPVVGACSTLMVETRAFGLSRLNIRKLFQSIALIGQVLCFVALPLIGCNKSLVLPFLFLQIIFFSFTNGGEVHIPTELSVDFSGTIYAIGNCVGSATGVVAPMLHGFIVSNNHNRGQWDIFFYISAVICAAGALLFLVYGDNRMRDFSKTVTDSQMDICRPSKGGSTFNLDDTISCSPTVEPTSIKTKRPAPSFPRDTRVHSSNSTAAIRAAWMESDTQQRNDSVRRL